MTLTQAFGFAQTAPETDTPARATPPAPPASAASAANLERVMVTGYRAAERAAIDAKARTRQVMDAVSQDDIGRLPDLNIVEASRRIPGISVVGGGDPTKNRDTYQRATLRGLDARYNLVTVDGVPIASDDPTYRGARLEMLPSTLVSQIQVIKTVTAEYDPHALGGQMNLLTRSAFAMGKPKFFVANASVGDNSSAGKLVTKDTGSYRADATGSLLFGSANQFGLVVSAEAQHLPSTAFSELPGDTTGAGWSYFTPSGARTPFKSASATGLIAPVRNQDYAFDNVRDRASVNSKLEYRFAQRSHVWAFAGYYFDKDKETRYEALSTPATSGAGATPNNAGATPAAPYTQTATSGQFALGDLQQGFTYQPVRRGTTLFNLDGVFEVGPNADLNVTGSTSKAIYREHRVMVKYDTDPKLGTSTNLNLPALGYTYQIDDGAPRLTENNPAYAANPSSYKGFYWRDIHRNLDNSVDFLRADYKFNFKPTDRGLGFNVGTNITRTVQSWTVQYVEEVPTNAAAQQALGPLTRVLLPQEPSTRETPQVPFLLIDPNAAQQVLQNNPTLFNTTDQRANNFGDNYLDVERVQAFYGQAIYQQDDWNALIGLRDDSTRLNVQGYAAPTTVGATAYTPTTRDGSYRFLLPSALVNYSLNDDMRIKGGVSRTIGRPDFIQYAARQTYSVGSNNVLTIAEGNPALQPREAWNYDLSYEWYLEKGGIVSAALFHKDIKNEIFTANSAGASTVYQGTTYNNVVVSEPLNSAKAALDGIELQYVSDRFDFLPASLRGLGIAANATYLKGYFSQPMSPASIALGGPTTRKSSGLIHQPNVIFNATLFYATGPLDARISLNRIGRALESTDQDTSERDLYSMPRTQLDLQGSYQISRQLKAVLQVQNLTKAAFVVRQGSGQQLLNNYFPVGRTAFIGFTYQPDL